LVDWVGRYGSRTPPRLADPFRVSDIFHFSLESWDFGPKCIVNDAFSGEV